MYIYNQVWQKMVIGDYYSYILFNYTLNNSYADCAYLCACNATIYTKKYRAIYKVSNNKKVQKQFPNKPIQVRQI